MPEALNSPANESIRAPNENPPDQENEFLVANRFGSKVLGLADRVGFAGYLQLFNEPSRFLILSNEISNATVQAVPAGYLAGLTDAPASGATNQLSVLF